MWIAAYILSVVTVNVAFTYEPSLSWLWSIGVGFIFVARDYCQRRLGHLRVATLMLCGIGLTALLSPKTALASGTAFAFSEAMDWAVFTATKRQIQDRVLFSCALSAPVDSAIFLGMIGILSPQLFGTQVASKVVAALIVWAGYRLPRYA